MSPKFEGGNALQALVDQLRTICPEVEVDLDLQKPDSSNISWMEIRSTAGVFDVEWSPSRGFGLHTNQEDGYEMKADENYTDIKSVFIRLVELING